MMFERQGLDGCFPFLPAFVSQISAIRSRICCSTAGLSSVVADVMNSLTMPAALSSRANWR